MAMSLSKFRSNLFKSFELMRDTHTSIEVYHRRKVYKINIEATGEKITKPYRRKKQSSNALPNALIHTEPCGDCGSLIINGVCSNLRCEKSVLG
jgi:hypothetical protein